MHLTRLLPLASTLLLTLASSAQEVCPCVPRPPLWVVKTCTDFGCAMTALNNGNGDPLTFVMPVGMRDHRWVVLQRVVAGSYTDDGSDPYQVEQFDGISVATARVASIADDHRPMIMTAPDGAFLVLSLKRAPDPRTRTVGH
jgi:hypothetical protein